MVQHLNPGSSPTTVFTEGIKQGQLVYQSCEMCSAVIFPPRVLCPCCGETALAWQQSAGHGTVYSVTTIYRRGEEPYNVALIDLAEGFRMMSRVEGIVSEQVRIGMQVRFQVSSVGDQALAIFVAEGQQS